MRKEYFKLKKMLCSRGFTLVELVVVIAILGILAAVIIPMLSNYITEAEYASVAQDVSNVYTSCNYIMLDCSTSDLSNTYLKDELKSRYDIDVNVGSPRGRTSENKIYIDYVDVNDELTVRYYEGTVRKIEMKNNTIVYI